MVCRLNFRLTEIRFVRITCRIAVLARNRQHSQAPNWHPCRKGANHQGLSTRAARYRQTALEADLQNLTSIAHEPSSFRSRKSDSPKAAHSGQCEPSVPFIRGPGCCSCVEVWRRLGGDNNGMVVVVVCFFKIVMADAVHEAQAENGSRHRRLVGKSPGAAAVI